MAYFPEEVLMNTFVALLKTAFAEEEFADDLGKNTSTTELAQELFATMTLRYILDDRLRRRSLCENPVTFLTADLYTEVCSNNFVTFQWQALPKMSSRMRNFNFRN